MSLFRIWFFRAVVGLFVVFMAIYIPFFSAPRDSMAQGLSPGISAGNTAPDFELPEIGGSTAALSKLKGKIPVLLYFWASWCPYCLSVRPEVINLRNKVPKSDLEVYAINVGGGDSLARVKKFEEAHPAPFTVLYDAQGDVARTYQVQGIPHFVLIDQNGIVKYSSNELPANPMKLLKQ